MNSLYIIIGAVVVVVLWVILTYNRLVALRNRVKEAFSDIDVQLKRRYNLIPNLIETVKGYATHEKEVLQKVTDARTRAMGATGVHEKAEAENMLTGALKSLFAVSESYPDLKASNNFLELQRELRDTEDKIQAARRFYNNTVMGLNNKIETFPSNVIAGMFKFIKEEFFELDDESERAVPEVKF
jgi:LemA protein